MIERRTRTRWVYDLAAPDAELTLTELMALCLMEMRDNALLGREALEHCEGMLGAIDDFFARANPDGYAGSGAVRAALDARRDEQRALAAAARSNGRTTERSMPDGDG